jgi:hypothetical protein
LSTSASPTDGESWFSRVDATGTWVAVALAMSNSLSFPTTLAALLLVSSAAFGCVVPQACPPAATAAAAAPSPAAPSPSPAERHVYRFDFVLTGTDAGGAPSTTAFTLNLQEAERGEVVIGKNVALSAPPAPGSPSVASPRQDVGIKVAASFRMAGDDVVLDVITEMSAFDPSTLSIRKLVARGNSLASAGKSALVATIDEEHRKVQLNVTPTKLR